MWFQYWDVSLRWQQASLHDNDSFAHNFEQQQIIFWNPLSVENPKKLNNKQTKNQKKKEKKNSNKNKTKRESIFIMF